MKQIDDTVIHKKFVMDACHQLAKWLFEQNRDSEAFALLNRAQVHDNQKFRKEEIDCLQQLINLNNGMVNPKYTMQESDKKLIETHWKNNRHHPEHFEKVTDMTELDIMEMVCDWFARSCQYDTDFLDFVLTRQSNRFHFPDVMFSRILTYCNILICSDHATSRT